MRGTRQAKIAYILFSISGLMALTNNCARNGFSSSVMESGDYSSLFSGVEKTLSGTGVVRNPAPNCVLKSADDFMDDVEATKKRIEPADCTTVNLSTPIFSWPMPLDIPKDADMTLEVITPNGSKITKTTKITRALVSTILPAGNYTWTVRYTNKLNQSTFSEPRHFTIPTIPLLAIPSSGDFTNAVYSKPRPRLMIQGRTYAQLESLLKSGEYANSYADFINRAKTFLANGGPAVPAKKIQANFATESDYKKWVSDIQNLAGPEATAVETLAFAGRISGNTDMINAAIARAVNLAKWDTQGPTSEEKQDQLNRRIFQQLGVVLDMFQNSISSTNQQILVDSLRDRVTQTMDKYKNFDEIPYNSHLVTATMFALETLMYAAGTPEFQDKTARDMLGKAWETAITVATTWGGSQDGGFGNGVAYGWFNMGNVARFMSTVRLVSGVNLARWPALAKYGENQIAFTAPNIKQMNPMGDGIEDQEMYSNYSWQDSRLLAMVTAEPTYEWYWRQDSRAPNLGVAVPPVHYMLYGALSNPPKAPLTKPAFPNSYVFADAGVAAIHSDTTSSTRSSVFFRSSRFGSFNHSHADQNSFSFFSKGKELFISGGYYPDYQTPHHKLVGRATRFKNALTVDGGLGQAEPISGAMTAPVKPLEPFMSLEASGKILNFDDNGTWAVVTGDATNAYRYHDSDNDQWSPLLTEALRSVFYNRKLGVVVIYDYAKSAIPRKWELNFQSPGLPIGAPAGMAVTTTRTGTQSLTVVNDTSSACLNIWAPSGDMVVGTTFPVNPEKTRNPQFHSRYSVATKTTTFKAVTIIRESCAPMRLDVQSYGTIGSRVIINDIPTVIAEGRTVILP